MTTPTVVLRVAREHPSPNAAALVAARLVAALNHTRAVHLDHVDESTIVLRVEQGEAESALRAEVGELLVAQRTQGWDLCPD